MGAWRQLPAADILVKHTPHLYKAWQPIIDRLENPVRSGHKSRIYNTQGQRFNRDTAYPARPLKNCGDVEITTSALPTNGAVTIAMTL